MKYISIFSGIEAASVAWEPLGWEPVVFSEFMPFPSAVLAHRYPNVPNVGDMTKHDWSQYKGKVDLVVGGPPCQAFSVAGLRKSLDDHRGNLSLEFMRAIHAIEPVWTVTENVPGWLSTKDNAFGCFLGGLVGLDEPFALPDKRGNKWPSAGVVTGPERTAAWRVLDAQYFGVAQRRKRVFVLSVRGSRNWRCAEALFPESEGVRWHHPPSRETGKRVAPTIAARTQGGGGLGTDFDLDGGLIQSTTGTVTSKWAKGSGGPAGDECQNLVPAVAETLLSTYHKGPGHNRDNNLITTASSEVDGQPIPYDLFQITAPINRQNRAPGDPCHTLARDNAQHAAIAFQSKNSATAGGLSECSTSPTLDVARAGGMAVAIPAQIPIGVDGGDVGFAVRASGSHSGDKGDGGMNTTVVIRTAQTSSNGWGINQEGTGYTMDGTQGQAVAIPINTQIATRHKAMGERTGLGVGEDGDPAFTLGAAHSHAVAVGTDCYNGAVTGDIAATVGTPGSSVNASGPTVMVGSDQAAPLQSSGAAQGMAVRRLTPMECERLQGFPDDWTNVPYRGKPATDTNRYKACGNSMAVPCMLYLGRRIQAVTDK